MRLRTTTNIKSKCQLSNSFYSIFFFLSIFWGFVWFLEKSLLTENGRKVFTIILPLKMLCLQWTIIANCNFNLEPTHKKCPWSRSTEHIRILLIYLLSIFWFGLFLFPVAVILCVITFGPRNNLFLESLEYSNLFRLLHLVPTRALFI